jgi:hypothetical protein
MSIATWAGKGLFSYCALLVALFLFAKHPINPLECMAGTTGLEPATSAVTGQYSGVTYRK